MRLFFYSLQSMKKKKIDQKKIRAIEFTLVTLLVLLIFSSVTSVLLFCHVASPNEKVSDNIVISKVSTTTKTSMFVSAPESIGVPIRIKIPSINIDAAVERVGLKSDGSMDVPKDPMDTGWYELGPRPGEIGSAVLDGHVDWWYGAPAVFPNLHEVQPGYIIIVEDDSGKTIPFIVRDVKTYGAADNATNIFVSNDGQAHLNLITCTGAWDYGTNQYANRLVVFADRDYR